MQKHSFKVQKFNSKEIEQQVKHYEAQTLNKLSNVNPRLKKSIVFFQKKNVQHIVSFLLIQNRLPLVLSVLKLEVAVTALFA